MKISEACAPNYHIFWILLDTAEMRDHMLAGLNRRGIAASFHYLPLHSSPLGREMGYKPDELPITEKVAACLLRLPIYAGMTESEMDYILQSIADVMGEM
jgi:dTDP-4-amino-4,6-dideoxygalactose transaminase